METVSKIWNDPVWSKVISAFIITAITLLYQYFNKQAKSRGFIGSIIILWTLKFELWIASLVFVGIYILNVEFPGYWNWSILVWIIILLIISAIRSSIHPNPPAVNDFQAIEFFDSNVAKKFDFNPTEEHSWVNNQREGDSAKGNFSFSNDIINIERINADGRYVVAISKYLAGGNRMAFIPRDISHGSKRIINFRFQAKMIGGFHYLLFVAKEVSSYHWIHNANTRIKIEQEQWQDFEVQIRVPADKDFRIDLDNREIEKAGTSMQIKDLIIEEVF